MIPAIFSVVVALLILGAVALFALWVVLGAERDAAAHPDTQGRDL
ncbi:hypothetical protein [Nocardiopsis sp. JB363]|nr:hypothetical protein [Nocardiopsis sp. JB363]SIO86979.1 hypothetical protein BQ8420_14560 [Nocardiopsis sp. JB363]